MFLGVGKGPAHTAKGQQIPLKKTAVARLNNKSRSEKYFSSVKSAERAFQLIV
jgi:hypothetical protein